MKRRIASAKKKETQLKKLPYLLIILIILLAALLVAALVQLNLINLDFLKKKDPPKLFSIADRCSIIAGKLIHTINDEGVCKVMCRGECGVRKMEFVNSEFQPQESSCHTCSCYCS